MEEKERYYYDGLGEDIFDSEIDDYPSNKTICDTLNQQNNKINELQEIIKTLKTSKTHFKKVAENVVDLLEDLNKYIGEPQKRELNYQKVIEDTKKYIEQLQQSQKELAISELEMFGAMLSRAVLWDNDYECWTIGDEVYDSFMEQIDDKIKSLKGEE